MGYLPSLGSKAAHFVSDLTTVILNPVSERESETSHLPEVDEVQENSEDGKDSEHNSDSLDGPDTSSFRAFLISFLSSSSSNNNDSMEILPEQNVDMSYPTLTPMGKGSKGRSGLISRGKHSIGKIINKAARIGGFKQATAAPKFDRETVNHTEPVAPVLELEESNEVASVRFEPDERLPKPACMSLFVRITFLAGLSRFQIFLYELNLLLSFLNYIRPKEISLPSFRPI